MPTRLYAFVKKQEQTPRVKHYSGFPTELTGGKDERMMFPWPHVLMIREDSDSSFLLYRYSKEGHPAGDTWHIDLDDAIDQAELEYEVSPTDWKAIPAESGDSVSFVLGLCGEQADRVERRKRL